MPQIPGRPSYYEKSDPGTRGKIKDDGRNTTETG
jgi:hypothetical protein